MDHKKVITPKVLVLHNGYKLTVGEGLVMSLTPDDNQITIGIEPRLLEKLKGTAGYIQPPK